MKRTRKQRAGCVWISAELKGKIQQRKKKTGITIQRLVDDAFNLYFERCEQNESFERSGK
jgi:hypothetical protein